MAHPFQYPYLTNRESLLINLPTGPIQLPQATAYTLIGVYPGTSNEVNRLRVANNVLRNGDSITKTALRTALKCKEQNCAYRMLALRNADEVALLEKGEHNHVVKSTSWRPKPINDPATIDATIIEVVERMRFDGDSDVDGLDDSKESDAPTNVENSAIIDFGAIEATINEVIEKLRNAGENNRNTANDTPSNIKNAVVAVPTPSKAQRQPTARGMGQRHWKQNCRTPWKFRTPFANFDDLVDCLMAQGATPHRIPYLQDGKVKRYYRCGKCNYFGLSYRHPNASKPCMLYETRIHSHDGVKVDPQLRHLYLEVPEELCLDDKAAYHDEADYAMEVDLPLRRKAADDCEVNEVVTDNAPIATDHADPPVTIETAAVRVKAPLVDYPDSDDSDVDGRNEVDDAMEVDASTDDAPKASDDTDSQTTDKAAAVNVLGGDAEATVAVPGGPVIDAEMAKEEKAITAIDALCQLFQHRAKVANLNAATTEGLQNTDQDLVREVFGEVDPNFEGYEDLKKMIYMVIPDAPKPPRRRKQARPMKVECIPAHGALSVWMARLRRLQGAVDEFVDQTREERRQRKQEPTSSTRFLKPSHSSLMPSDTIVVVESCQAYPPMAK